MHAGFGKVDICAPGDSRRILLWHNHGGSHIGGTETEWSGASGSALRLSDESHAPLAYLLVHRCSACCSEAADFRRSISRCPYVAARMSSRSETDDPTAPATVPSEAASHAKDT